MRCPSCLFWALEVCMSISFLSLGKFFALISVNNFSFLLFLSQFFFYPSWVLPPGYRVLRSCGVLDFFFHCYLWLLLMHTLHPWQCFFCLVLSGDDASTVFFFLRLVGSFILLMSILFFSRISLFLLLFSSTFFSFLPMLLTFKI